MKFHLIKRSIAQEVADELDATTRQRREALEHCEYWGAMHVMLTDREQRLRQELAEHAGAQTVPVRVEYKFSDAPARAPLDKHMTRLFYCSIGGVLMGCVVALLRLAGVA